MLRSESLRLLRDPLAFSLLMLATAFASPTALAQETRRDVPDFQQDILPLFNRYCTSCHNADDKEGGLAMESFSLLAAGGESGPAVLPSDVEGSRLWRLVVGTDEPKMPPDDMQGPTQAELEILSEWIKAGAAGPTGDSPRPTRLVVPHVPAAPVAALPISAVAWHPTSNVIAIGRYQLVELFDATSGERLRSIQDLPGKVNSVQFSREGDRLLTSSGITGLYGQADLWDTDTGEHITQLRGHRDTLYCAALSPDDQVIATASYDGRIILWQVSSGSEIRTLSGHNGPVFDLEFSPTEQKLVSTSADQTLKVWSLVDGERLDTLGQPLKEQFTGEFSPDGTHIVGGGGDNRIRMWRVEPGLDAKINPILYARFAHEGPIVSMAFSPDGRWLVTAAEDRTIKLWQVEGLVETYLFPEQSDVVTGLAFSPDNQRFVVARMDGSWDVMKVPQVTGESQAPAVVEVSPVPMPQSSETSVVEEQEPNGLFTDAQRLALPAEIRGRLHQPSGDEDFDHFRFQAQAGQQWVIEVNASRSGSPVDSRIQIFDAQGDPVPRMLLQAIRDSYFTFRGKDSSTSDDFRLHNWEEMELNEYLYCNGEVVKLWLYPRGPDSGFKVYPGTGSRYNYFDTTPTTHALGEPCYIVQPYPVGTELIPNGLPVFTVNYENDDDSRRRWGSDSRLTFTAPSDGDYVLRVSDARGFDGEDFTYTATIRPRKPDFEVTLGGANPKVSPGSGREISVQATRLDDFEGEIRVSIEGLPPGFHVTNPIVIQADQDSALGVIWADEDAPVPTEEDASATTVIAAAEIQGQTVEHAVNNLGKIELGEPAKALIRITSATGNVSSVDGRVVENPPEATPWPGDQPLELTLEAGTTIAARVLVKRNELEGRIPFGNEDSGRNLPHGVIVDNIGLNGLLIIEDQQERVFFLTAAKWVPPQSRLFHLRAQVDGNQCSLPVILRIVPPGGSSVAQRESQ